MFSKATDRKEEQLINIFTYKGHRTSYSFTEIGQKFVYGMGLYEWKFMSSFSLTETSESNSDWIQVPKAHRNVKLYWTQLSICNYLWEKIRKRLVGVLSPSLRWHMHTAQQHFSARCLMHVFILAITPAKKVHLVTECPHLE